MQVFFPELKVVHLWGLNVGKTFLGLVQHLDPKKAWFSKRQHRLHLWFFLKALKIPIFLTPSTCLK
jgi:hypothetical protein